MRRYIDEPGSMVHVVLHVQALEKYADQDNQNKEQRHKSNRSHTPSQPILVSDVCRPRILEHNEPVKFLSRFLGIFDKGV